jgi:hypothetical protein
MQIDYTTKSQAGAEPLPDAVQGISCSSAPNAAGKESAFSTIRPVPAYNPSSIRLFLSRLGQRCQLQGNRGWILK